MTNSDRGEAGGDGMPWEAEGSRQPTQLELMARLARLRYEELQRETAQVARDLARSDLEQRQRLDDAKRDLVRRLDRLESGLERLDATVDGLRLSWAKAAGVAALAGAVASAAVSAGIGRLFGGS